MTGMGEGEGVSAGANKLVECIRANPGKRSSQIKEALNLPQRTMERWLKQLKGDGIIEFHDAPKTGGYFAS